MTKRKDQNDVEKECYHSVRQAFFLFKHVTPYIKNSRRCLSLGLKSRRHDNLNVAVILRNVSTKNLYLMRCFAYAQYDSKEILRYAQDDSLEAG